MPTYQTALFQITALTNLHVGSGSQNYGIIDKLVQRDPLTNYPFIHASSLKGALRQFCVEQWGNPKDSDLRYIFGQETKDDKTDEASSAGNFRFLDARLLSMPVRSDQLPYFNLTSPKLIQDFLDTVNDFGRQLTVQAELENFKKQLPATKQAVHFAHCGAATLENTDIKASKETFVLTSIQQLLGPHPALITNDRSKVTDDSIDSSYPCDLFKLLTDDFHLPVMARNKVGTGSENDDSNLWYEQILPRQTRFYFVLLYPKTASKQFEKLKTALEADTVHIGANASVGYGFCKINLISTTVTSTPKKP